MSYSRTSFAFDAAVGNERDAVWNRLPDFGRKSKRKVIGDVVHQQFNPSFQQQQNDPFHTFHHQQMQGPGILLDPSLPPQHPPHQHLHHQQLPHLYNQHVNYHNHHPSISHPVIPPPVAYDAAFPPRPPVIDPITSLPVSVSVPMPVPVPVVNDPVSTQFRRPPPAPLHTNLFPSVDLSEQQSPLPPHHLRRPPFHVNPVVPPREVVGNYESESHPLADMVANDTEQQQFERPPFDDPTPNTTEIDNQEEDCPPEQKDYSKRRRIFQVGNANGTDCQTLLNTNFPNPACAPSIQSPTHTSTNSSVVSMSPAVQPLAAPAASALPTPSPLSLSVQSTTRLFADSSTVSSIASSTSSIASSVSHSLVSSSPNLISTPIATLVRSPLLRPLNGRYAHLHAITNKGFGATYKAWDLQTSKPVFLKRTVLSSKMFSQREAAFMKLFTCFRRRYPGSLRFLVDYVDDFICQLDTNEAPCHWLALDYVSGGDLVQLLRECHSLARPLQEDDVRIIIHRLCEAIGELHALRVVHMDVSLENICIQWLNNENGVDDDMRVQLLLIDFEWSMMDMRGNALQQMVAQMEAEAQAANGTAHFQEMQTSAIEMRKAYDHVMLHPTPMHFYSDQYSDRRLRLQRRHEAVGKISYLSSEAKNLHSSFDPYKNEVFAIGACAYRLMFMCGPGEKNALTDSRTISNEFLSFLTETFQPEEKRIHTEEMLSHPWLTVMSNPNHSHHVRARSQSLAAAHQQMNMNHVTRVTDNGGADRWQHLEMDEKSRENSS